MLRERLMVVGGPGTGKSHGWMKLAERFPGSTFYCIDTDDSAERTLTLAFPHLKNVVILPAVSWSFCESSLGSIRQKAKRGDWVVVDMVCSTWDFVQAHFVQEIFGKKIDDYFMEARRSLKKGEDSLQAFKGWVDWNVINKLYQDWINEICYGLPAHVYLAAKSTPIGSRDETEIKDLFSSFGVRNEGEKRNAFRVHTVLLLSKDRKGWRMSTVKDRGRRLLDNIEVIDFALQYGAVAQW